MTADMPRMTLGWRAIQWRKVISAAIDGRVVHSSPDSIVLDGDTVDAVDAIVDAIASSRSTRTFTVSRSRSLLRSQRWTWTATSDSNGEKVGTAGEGYTDRQHAFEMALAWALPGDTVIMRWVDAHNTNVEVVVRVAFDAS